MAPPLQSRFLTLVVARKDGQDEFTEDVRLLLASKDRIDAKWAIPIVQEFDTTRNEAQLERRFEEVCAQHELDRATMRAMFRFTRSLLKHFSKPEHSRDTVDMLLVDIGSLGALNTSGSEKDRLWLEAYLKALTASSGQYKAVEERELTAMGLAPVLNGWGTTVELRAAFKPRFTMGDQAAEFQGKIAVSGDLVPIISVLLRFDSGSTDSIYFQVRPEDLKYVVESLAHAINQARYLTEHVRIQGGP